MFGAGVQQSSVFGAPKTTTGFTFGPTNPVATTAGFAFGATNPSSVGSAGTLFSSTATPTANVLGTNTLSGFGANPGATKQSFTFGQPNPLTTMAGGGQTTGLFGGGTVTSTGFTSLGGTGTFGAPSVGTGLGLQTSITPSLGMGFGTSLATNTTAPSLGLSMFGGPAATTTAPSLGLGPFGSTPVSSTMSTLPSLGLGGIPPAPAPTTGLGGASTTQKTTSADDSKTLKEYPVPPEIITLVEDFKKYIKEQKTIREEIARHSPKSLSKVQEETTSLKQLLSVISNGIQRNLSSVRQLKQDTIQELQNAETMQRTKDVPLSLQYENTAPMEYFQRLIAGFETKMQTYRQQIKMLEKHLGSITQPSGLTPQELVLAIKKIHETFVFLAAELQTIHETVASLKERYLAYRRLVHGDSTNVFESNKPSAMQGTSRLSRAQATMGPSPFSEIHSTATAAAFASALEKTRQPPATSLGMPFGISSGLSGQGTTTFGMPSFSAGSSSLAVKPLGK